MTYPYNPISLAREAQNMARNAHCSEGRIFQRVALISMCVVAAATATQLMLQIRRELYREDHPRSR